MRLPGRLRAFVLIDRELPPPAAALLWVVLMMFAVSFAALLGLYATPVLGGWALLLAAPSVLLALAAGAACLLCLRAWRRPPVG